MGSKEESSTHLDSSRDELAALEIQRVDGVLEDCIWNVEALSLLPAIMADLDRLSVVLGPTLVGALKEHHLLGERLEAHRLERAEGQGMPPGLEQSFCCCLRTVLRHLRARPAVCRELRAKATAGQYRKMAEGLKELQGLLMEKMLMGPTEVRERSRYLKELSVRHRKNTELVSKLEQEVEEATEEKNADIAKRDKLIRRLKVSMHLTKKASDEVLDGMEHEVEEHKRVDRTASEARRAEKQQEADKLQAQLKSLAIENRDSETALRKKKARVETEIENWIQKYDVDMAEKQAELEELSRLHEREQEEVPKLEELCNRMEEERSRTKEQRRQSLERKQEEEAEVIVDE
ncbi:dynein regulatory complex protein 10-like [Anguilla rostrata]|uniref:dynein regulatory complex protein 10-like n=1 Tax=Anguilla rostrata TaxID=7938 RepID=UPI0030D08AA5